MPTISLTLPVSATTITAGLHSANYSTIQTLLNGSLDTSNWAGGKIFAPSKLTQEGATSNQVIQWNGSSWVPATITSSAPNYSTVLPGSPADTTEAFLVDSTTLPTYQWRFRWNNGSSNTDKWEFIGGAPVMKDANGSFTITSATYQDPTPLVSFAVPRAGVYRVTYSAEYSGANTAVVTLKKGASAAADADSLNIANTANGWKGSRSFEITGLAANDVLKLQAKVSTGTGVSLVAQSLTVVPVRVS